MTARNKIHVLVLLVFFVIARANIFPFLPSYGDIVIVNGERDSQVYKYVMISLAPDGMEPNEYLVHLCVDGITSYGDISQVISRQLGYKKKGCSTTWTRPSDSGYVGIKCPNCTGSESHILRCCNVEAVFNATEKYCRSALALDGDCKPNRAIYNLKNHGNKAYQGEVLLFPPVTRSTLGTATPSMGLVAVKKEGDGCSDWRFIMKDTYTVDQSVTTTICRQMGFTNVNPGFVMTLSEFEDFFPFNFSIWNDEIKDPYLPTSKINCESSQSCLACCNYNNNLENCKAPGPPPLDKGQLLVIRCSFYMEEHLSRSGSEDICKFTNGEHTICRNDITMETSKFIAVVAVPSGVLLVVCVILTVTTILLCLKCHCRDKCLRGRRNGYENVDGVNQQQGGNQNQQGEPNPRD